MSERRYVLHPAFVTSQSDGQRHYISALMLARLYRVPMDECVCFDPRSGWVPPDNAIHLRPRFDGDYTLPTS